MNNVYNNQKEFYGARADMCFDNKGMVTPAQAERGAPPPPPPPSIRLNIPAPDDRGRSGSASSASKLRFRAHCQTRYFINTVIAIFVLSMLLLLELGYIPGTQQGFVCKNPEISHKFTGDTITVTSLLTGTFVIPIVVLLITEFLSLNTFKRLRVNILWFYYKECVIGVTLALLITEIGKVIVGEHRPHFFDVCDPIENKDCTEGTFIPAYTCTSDKYSAYFLVDTSRSFPSGHASTSIFISIFCAYVIQTRLRTTHTGQLLRPLLMSVCLTWGLVCSLTRITDRRHHWWDVLAGGTLGAAVALYTLVLLRPEAGRLDVDGRVSTSTTTLLDIKNKDAKSEII